MLRQRRVIGAVINHLQAVGPVARLKLDTADGKAIEAQLTRERFRDLALRNGEQVFVQSRHLCLFLPGVHPVSSCG